MGAAPTNQPVVIGLDLGTSACKALAFAADGHRLAEAQRFLTTERDGLACEQSPQQWIAAVVDCLGGVAHQLGGAAVAGIGLSGQIGTHLLVDQAMRPLAPAVTWQDARSGEVLTRVAEAVPDAWLAQHLGARLPPSPTWPLPRLYWLTQRYPALVEAARYLLSPKDYVAWWLTGRLVGDVASWRGLARPDGTVADEALRRLGLPDLLPPLAGPTNLVGHLLPTVAEAVRLPPDTPVVVGMSDLNAGLIGLGAIDVAQGFDVGGTSEHLGVVATTPVADWRIASLPLYGVDLGLYSVYGVTSNAGSVVSWLEQTLVGPGEAVFDLAAQAPAGASGLLCLPYLHGERAPIWNARATGGYVGLTERHRRPDLIRAALEGVACNLRAIARLIPAEWCCHQPIRTTGGTAGSPLWNSIKAAVLDQPLQLLREPQAASLGAAILAAVGTGLVASSRDGVAAMVRCADLVEPDTHLVALYEDVFDRYQRAALAWAGLPQPDDGKDQS